MHQADQTQNNPSPRNSREILRSSGQYEFVDVQVHWSDPTNPNKYRVKALDRNQNVVYAESKMGHTVETDPLRDMHMTPDEFINGMDFIEAINRRERGEKPRATCDQYDKFRQPVNNLIEQGRELFMQYNEGLIAHFELVFKLALDLQGLLLTMPEELEGSLIPIEHETGAVAMVVLVQFDQFITFLMLTLGLSPDKFEELIGAETNTLWAINAKPGDQGTN